MKKLLEDIKTVQGDNTGTRLMILGSENDDIQFINMVESVNGTVVINDHCVGTRYFWNNVEEKNGDIIEDIAERCVKRPVCPSKDWIKRSRIDRTLELVKDFDAKGAIVIYRKFCDPHKLDIPSITKYFLPSQS